MVWERKEVTASLRELGTAGYTETFPVKGVLALFGGECHDGEDGIEGEVENGVDELWEAWYHCVGD